MEINAKTVVGGIAIGAGAWWAGKWLFGGGDNTEFGTGADKRLLEAAWQVAGREESRNNVADWRENDLGGKVSAGYIHLNQGYTLPDLFQIAARRDNAQFRALVGAYADNLLNPVWVKSTDLNEPGVKQAIIRLLGSPLGQLAQKEVFYTSYWTPGVQALLQVHPNADDVYKVTVAATKVWTSELDAAMRASATADAFAQYLINNPISKDPDAEIAKWRMPRTVQNARSMLATGRLANT